MNAAQLREKCLAQQALVGERAKVTFVLYGKPWGRRVNGRLWPGGPTGRIVGDTLDRPGVIAMFDAAAVIAALDRMEASARGGTGA